MNCLVCVKQVPAARDAAMDPETGALLRDAMPGVVNPYDLYALETALRVRESAGKGRITALSMGPMRAMEALRECLSLGADAAYLACDAAFAGSDTLATSYVLSRAIAMLEAADGPFDLIFCGKQSTDGETAHVGAQIAEYLGRTQITGVTSVEVSGNTVRAGQETDSGRDALEAALPCLVTVGKPEYEPRYPTISSILAANRAEITVLRAADLGVDTGRTGLNGSPTRVARLFAPAVKKGGRRFDGNDLRGSVATLCAILCEARPIWGRER